MISSRKIKIYLYSVLCLALLIWYGASYINQILYFTLRPIAKHIMQREYSDVKPDRLKILAIWHWGMGEMEQTKRLKVAMDRIGVEFKQVSEIPETFWSKFVLDAPQIALNAMNPDIIITLQASTKYYAGAKKNFKVLDMNADKYIYRKADGKLYLADDLNNYDGFLISFPEVDLIAELNQQHNKNYYYMQWYPTLYKTKFKPMEPRSLLYMGGFDKTRSSSKYKQFISMIDAAGYLEYPSNPNKFISGLAGKKEQIPYDGVSLLNEIHRAGVFLVLHKNEHLSYGVPTGRIFEGAAANVIMISDENKFVRDNFGDNVLYIDVNQEAEVIAQQIEEHMRWIFANQDEAKAKADRCHTILNENFALEDQLQRFIASIGL